MKKFAFLLVLACLFCGTGLADVLTEARDVFDVTTDGKTIEIVDVIDIGTSFSILESMTTDGSSPFDTRFSSSSPIIWQKIAYTNHGGVASEGWIVSNPEVITEYYLDLTNSSAGFHDAEWDGHPTITGTGFVLCESLSLRERPIASSAALITLPYGATCEILDGNDLWYIITYHDLNGYRYEGYVRNEYVLVNPQYYSPVAETAVYAMPSAESKRVGLIEVGTSYPIIGEMDGYYAISLRGASGFVVK